MAFGQGVVSVCGSRSLPASASGLVGRAVSTLLASGRGLVVGCATGADTLAPSSAVQAGAHASVSVFAAFGPGGQGACQWSPVEAVAGFERAGGGAVWWRFSDPVEAWFRLVPEWRLGVCERRGWPRAYAGGAA